MGTTVNSKLSTTLDTRAHDHRRVLIMLIVTQRVVSNSGTDVCLHLVTSNGYLS